jgi:endogenous inhibitor of DNA gyrase (YacG/DUF329 family)
VIERGIPTAHCPRCDTERVVWRDAVTDAPLCLACDAPIDLAWVGGADLEHVANVLGMGAWTVTETAEPCGCADTHADDAHGCGDCPAHGKCAHTRAEAS